MSKADLRVPVILLTGFLGAGKTTYLNRIIASDKARRYAVIVNEIGEIGIDGELIRHEGEELRQLANGCICCTVRGICATRSAFWRRCSRAPTQS